MSFKYGAYVKHFYYLKKGKKMKNEFKAGDLVFELTASKGILLTTICRIKSCDYYLSTNNASYTMQGVNAQLPISRLFHATPENRQALVTLYGEDAVPEIPLRGSELTKKLMRKQKYVLCYVSDVSDDEARENPYLVIIKGYRSGGWFDEVTNDNVYKYAVPVDKYGNEITEIE